jgi:hypothetical protein
MIGFWLQQKYVQETSRSETDLIKDRSHCPLRLRIRELGFLPSKKHELTYISSSIWYGKACSNCPETRSKAIQYCNCLLLQSLCLDSNSVCSGLLQVKYIILLLSPWSNAQFFFSISAFSESRSGSEIYATEQLFSLSLGDFLPSFRQSSNAFQ